MQTMETGTRHRLSYAVCLLYSCAVLVGGSGASSASPVQRDDDCAPELCWDSPHPISDWCAAQCERWIATADDDASTLPVVTLAAPPRDKRAHSSFIRVRKSAVADKRYSSFVRIGRPAVGDKRYSSFVRIGRAGAPARYDVDAPYRRSFDQSVSPAFNKRRHSSFVRIGRYAAV